ncbi:Golgi resident protein GCP60 [Saguinus oedipus]|uniref:Golgi resident protein GCP60 n=1 Tax=Saguinus oedipus TaxID=9490 RepID=A0ABQ9W512_SAGOE|nr:Golgi resident protein GCP60 [Saguinus oedipus]
MKSHESGSSSKEIGVNYLQTEERWKSKENNYDIGFGVYFEWTDSPNTAVSVYVSESSDDDEEEEENISCEEKAKKNANKLLLDEIVPVYRRD